MQLKLLQAAAVLTAIGSINEKICERFYFRVIKNIKKAAIAAQAVKEPIFNQRKGLENKEFSNWNPQQHF